MENPINYWYQKYLSLKAEIDKMKAEAVEGEIVYSGFDDGTTILRAIVPDRRYDRGDKVHIIVLPKED